MTTSIDTQTPLRAGTIQDLLGSANKQIIFADQNTSLNEACAILKKNHISSLPIFDSANKSFVGLVDCTDICLLIVFAYAQKTKEVPSGNIYEEDLFKNVKIVDLLRIADEGKLGWTFSPERNVEDTMEAFSKGIHRAVIHADDGYHLLSQLDAIKFLYNSHKYDSIFNTKLADLPRLFAFQPPLVTIDRSTPAIEGFKKIGREHFGAVPVLDDKGRLIASLCATDLSGTDPTLLHTLLLPTSVFLKIVHDNKIPPPLTASSDDTLADIVKKMIDTNEHRVWMLDGQGQLNGVITLSDVCKVFVPQ
jgi:CBS domain-containing protein